MFSRQIPYLKKLKLTLTKLQLDNYKPPFGVFMKNSEGELISIGVANEFDINIDGIGISDYTK